MPIEQGFRPKFRSNPERQRRFGSLLGARSTLNRFRRCLRDDDIPETPDACCPTLTQSAEYRGISHPNGLNWPQLARELVNLHEAALKNELNAERRQIGAFDVEITAIVAKPALRPVTDFHQTAEHRPRIR